VGIPVGSFVVIIVSSVLVLILMVTTRAMVVVIAITTMAIVFRDATKFVSRHFPIVALIGR
jgi:hypothetical protein